MWWTWVWFLFQLVAAWFTLFDVIFLILLLPLFDRVIYPYLKKRDRPVGIVCRISIGMMFATAAVMVAGVVELFRLKQVWPDEDKPCCSTTINQTIGKQCYSFKFIITTNSLSS